MSQSIADRELPLPAGRRTSFLSRVLQGAGKYKYPLINAAILLLIWQISSAYVPAYIFPTIPQVWAKLAQVLLDHGTYAAVADTLRRILGGFVSSSILGIAIGILIAMSRRANAMLGSLLRLILGIPALTWVLLAIIWFRSPELRVWFLMFVLVFPIVAVNTADGVRAVPAELYQMVRSLRPTSIGMLRMLILPATTPFIFSGLKVSLSFGGRIAVFGEALSASTGIGAAMYTANQLFDTAGILVWTGILIVLLTALDKILEVVESHWFKWRVSIEPEPEG
jgi:ABC-type nitrate/sulfonate/bicarbonate transport system permease component